MEVAGGVREHRQCVEALNLLVGGDLGRGWTQRIGALLVPPRRDGRLDRQRVVALLVALGRGRTAVGRGRTAVGRGRTAVGRGRTAVGRGGTAVVCGEMGHRTVLPPGADGRRVALTHARAGRAPASSRVRTVASPACTLPRRATNVIASRAG